MKTMFETRNNLPAATREKVTQLLNQALADLTDLYSQSKQAHWNLRGPLFISLHKLFDEVAASVEEHLDTIAERITALGGIANGTVRQAAAHSALPEFPAEQPNELSYLTALVERFGQCAGSIRKGIDNCMSWGDADSADLLTALSRDLDKSLWLLEAHTRS